MAVDPVAATWAEGSVIAAHPRRAEVRLSVVNAAVAPALPPLILLQCLGKADKPEQVLRAATALGASEVIFAVAERSIAGPADERRERWLGIVKDVALQSERGRVPLLHGPEPLPAALARVSVPVRLVLDPEATLGMLEALERDGVDRGCALLVGPEGGLSARELEEARNSGFRPVRLGPHVLRTELAASAALAVAMAVASRN